MTEQVTADGFVDKPSPPRHARVGYEYAGFWIRAAASLLDGVFALILSLGVALLIGIVLGLIGVALGVKREIVSNIAFVLGFLSVYAVGVGYQVVFLTGGWQATPGKRLCGIYVIKEDGTKLTAGRAVGRYFSYIVSAATFYVGYAMAGWTDQKKALHDIICETRVVHGKR